jgi:prepilin-type N-terminal cleavage/methylation domain-containing protein
MRPMRRRARSRGGYTLIEVMMALVVMTGGALALLSMQEASIHGNLEARQMSTATQLAGSWIERLHRDAYVWTQGGASFNAALSLNQTRFLRDVTPLGQPLNWVSPSAAQIDRTALPAGIVESWGADHWGRETRVAADMEYCTNLRLAWVYFGSAMRADVRVWYLRSRPNSSVGLTGCGQGTDPNVIGLRSLDIRAVHASTVLRWTPVPAQ